MTLVRFRFLAGDGTPVTAGQIIFVPLSRYTDADGVHLPIPDVIQLDKAQTHAEIVPSTADFCWVVREQVPDAGRALTRFVTVPATPEILDYEDLPDVDRTTFSPTPETLPGWTATLAAINALTAQIAADATTSTANAATVAGDRLAVAGDRTATTQARDGAVTANNAAQTAETNAETAQTDAETAANTATTAANTATTQANAATEQAATATTKAAVAVTSATAANLSAAAASTSAAAALAVTAEKRIAVFRPNLAVPGLFQPNPDIWFPSLPLPQAAHSVRVTDPLWTKPADGAPVASIRNGGTVGGDLTQATPASRPLYKAADPLMNNMPSLVFDGVNDSIGLDIADMAIPVWLVAIAAAKVSLPNAYYGMIIGTSSSNRGLALAGTGSGNKINLRFSASFALSVGTLPLTPGLIIGKATATESTISLNGIQETLPPIDGVPVMFSLGANGVSNPLNGSIAYAAIFTQDPQLDPNWPNLLTLARACGVRV